MPKCDTEITPQISFMDGGKWCGRCWLEYNQQDGEPKTWCCLGCNLVHLDKRMTEKLEGHYCLSCAKEYEEKLLGELK